MRRTSGPSAKLATFRSADKAPTYCAGTGNEATRARTVSARLGGCTVTMVAQSAHGVGGCGVGELAFRWAEARDLPRIKALEAASYPADEAATPQRLEFRLAHAAEFFLVCEDPSSHEVVGFVCATVASGDALTEESMASHDPRGDNLCIHSVVVEQARRRRGIASAMLAHYVSAIDAREDRAKPRLASLLSKEHLCPFYQAAGFSLIGPSPVEHGSEQWFLLQRPFRNGSRHD